MKSSLFLGMLVAGLTATSSFAAENADGANFAKMNVGPSVSSASSDMILSASFLGRRGTEVSALGVSGRFEDATGAEFLCGWVLSDDDDVSVTFALQFAVTSSDEEERGITSGTTTINAVKLTENLFEFGGMLIPEWKITDNFRLGLRLGVAIDVISYDLDYDVKVRTTRYRGKQSGSEASLQGLAGVEARYMFAENHGIMAFVDARLCSSTDMWDDIVKADPSGWAAGIGYVAQF